jgi:hypothetical protein
VRLLVAPQGLARKRLDDLDGLRRAHEQQARPGACGEERDAEAGECGGDLPQRPQGAEEDRREQAAGAGGRAQERGRCPRTSSGSTPLPSAISTPSVAA